MVYPSQRFLRNAALAGIIVSFILSILTVILDVGIWNTPYETRDSHGRPMGFNDPLSAEHYGIIVSNFRVQHLFRPVYAYTWALWIMHALGVGLLWRVGSLGASRVRWFFGLQGALFPVGWLGFLTLPLTVDWILTRTFDREAIIDIPFIATTAHPIWIATAMLIFAVSWKVSRQPIVPQGASGAGLA